MLTCSRKQDPVQSSVKPSRRHISPNTLPLGEPAIPTHEVVLLTLCSSRRRSRGRSRGCLSGPVPGFAFEELCFGTLQLSPDTQLEAVPSHKMFIRGYGGHVTILQDRGGTYIYIYTHAHKYAEYAHTHREREREREKGR